MELVQKTHIQIEKDGKLVEIIVPSDMPLGLLFDALMEAKGYAVDRMIQAQKAEEAEACDQIGPPEPIEPEAE